MWHVEVFIHQSQPHGKYLFQSGWKVLDPCIKFHFQISVLTNPAPHDGAAGNFGSYVHHMGGWERTKSNMIAGWLVSLSQNGRPTTCFCPTENLSFSFTTSHVACGSVHPPIPTPRQVPFSKWLEGVGSLHQVHFQISVLTNPAPHDGAAGNFVSYVHLLAFALTVCI
jgi:hypothetical protein